MVQQRQLGRPLQSKLQRHLYSVCALPDCCWDTAGSTERVGLWSAERCWQTYCQSSFFFFIVFRFKGVLLRDFCSALRISMINGHSRLIVSSNFKNIRDYRNCSDTYTQFALCQIAATPDVTGICICICIWFVVFELNKFLLLLLLLCPSSKIIERCTSLAFRGYVFDPIPNSTSATPAIHECF